MCPMCPMDFVPFAHFEHRVDRFASNHGIKHFEQVLACFRPDCGTVLHVFGGSGAFFNEFKKYFRYPSPIQTISPFPKNSTWKLKRAVDLSTSWVTGMEARFPGLCRSSTPVTRSASAQSRAACLEHSRPKPAMTSAPPDCRYITTTTFHYRAFHHEDANDLCQLCTDPHRCRPGGLRQLDAGELLIRIQ